MRAARLALVLLAGLAGTASAATLHVSGGQLLGASDVMVDGQAWNVSFVDGTCAGLFGGCDEASDFAFNSFADAQAAADALFAQVWIDGPQGNFDSQQELTNGCTSTTSGCNAYVPYATTPSGSVFLVSVVFAQNKATEPEGSSFGAITSVTDFGPPDTSNVFAVFTPVPLPAGGWLLAAPLAPLLRRRSTPA